MARAETIESVGETGGGGNGPLRCHNSGRMELSHPLRTWPGLISPIATGSGTRGIYLHHHHLHPLVPLHLSYPLPDEPQTHQQFSVLSPSFAPPRLPLCVQREGRDPSSFSGDESDSDIEEHQFASRQRKPLPDLLPQNEHPSWASPHNRVSRRELVLELKVRSVASQLRAVGDQFNATVLCRAHFATYWQDWRDACRGLLHLICQTLSTLYRLT